MKRLVSLALSLLMLLPACALADSATANGVVKSAQTYEVLAPYSGVTLPFDWERGDAVAATDTLFEMDTLKVYAPEDGTVAELFVDAGDLCEDAARRYGMVAAIEREHPLVVSATTRGAYKSSENMLLHLGARVYFEQSGSGDNKGEGVIASVQGSAFTVELDAGEFDPDDTVKIYRDLMMGSKTCIGQGTIARAADVAVNAAGRVLKLCVAKGQRVQKGQLMMELASSDAERPLAGAAIPAGHDGALESVKIAQGQQVYKGQALATIADLKELCVLAEVDEIDLGGVQLGDTLKIVLDRYPDSELAGTVKSISRMGTPKQNAAYYDVELSFTSTLEVLPGMNATVYIPTEQE